MRSTSTISTTKLLGRRQAVRHWVLISACAGSNPAAPAIFNLILGMETCINS